MTGETLRQLGEIEVIRRLARGLGQAVNVLVGIGDDAAVVRSEDDGHDLVLTTDAVIEGIHFAAGARSAAVGRKLAGRLLSDLAAMGAEPLWILCNVAAPARTSFRALKQVYAGMKRIAARFGAHIVGGDLSRADELHLHGFAVGRVPHRRAVTRSGARAGDAVFVTGTLGGSILGGHLRFTPRVKEGLWLRKSGWPSAMIDVSDGLLRDLGHILRSSRCAAEIELRKIPVSSAARMLGDGVSPLDHALRDGEDFELLFTVPAGKAEQFIRSWKDTFRLRCTRIGTIRSGPVSINLKEAGGSLSRIYGLGYDHFSCRVGKRP